MKDPKEIAIPSFNKISFKLEKEFDKEATKPEGVDELNSKAIFE